eukprot:GHVS01058964.1.p1 GENE.GHVS01058964.1~~GHVS01058964.1.p1  ORF type:complete len:581 (-),score=80.74 GHVS01058964.1:527-2269(-)
MVFLTPITSKMMYVSRQVTSTCCKGRKLLDSSVCGSSSIALPSRPSVYMCSHPPCASGRRHFRATTAASTTRSPSSAYHCYLSTAVSPTQPQPSSADILQAYKKASEQGSLRDLAALVERTTKVPINPLSINDIINQTAQAPPKPLGRKRRRGRLSVKQPDNTGGFSTSHSPSSAGPLLLTQTQPIPASALLSSANWVQRELPTRLAHRLHDFHRLPHIIVGNPFVKEVHRLYCKAYAELFAFGPLSSLAQEVGFTKVLKLAVEEHSHVVGLMQKGVSELKVSHPDIVIDHFLDRLFVTRIGNRLLAEHHLALHEDFQHGEWNSDYIGIVNQRTMPAKMIRLIADRVSQVAVHTYSCCPQVVVVGDVDISFPYIPEHLRFVIFEMLKNAIRATIEKHKDKPDQLPLVTVGVHKGQTELFIKIQDRGGGIPAECLQDVWKYGFTTVRSAEGGCEQREMAGYGFGLPLSRLYTRYFGGDLDFKSMAGYGLDTYIRLPRLGTQRESAWMLNNHLHLWKQSSQRTDPPVLAAHSAERNGGTTTRRRSPPKARGKGQQKSGHSGFVEAPRPLAYTSINGRNLYNG